MVERHCVAYAAATDPGIIRLENQDSLFAGRIPVEDSQSSDVFLFLIADGMGGYLGGDIASRIARDEFCNALQARNGALPRSEESETWQQLLYELVQYSNSRILQVQREMYIYRNMGTTFTAAIVCDNYLHTVHIGDSRMYLHIGNALQQFTRDHSLVAELIRQGQLTADQARVHPRRNVISQALGVAPDVDVDTCSMLLEPNTGILLCSDGLSGMLTDDEMAEIMNGEDSLQQVAMHLVDLANERGGRDNISVVVARYLASEAGD